MTTTPTAQHRPARHNSCPADSWVHEVEDSARDDTARLAVLIPLDALLRELPGCWNAAQLAQRLGVRVEAIGLRLRLLSESEWDAVRVALRPPGNYLG